MKKLSSITEIKISYFTYISLMLPRHKFLDYPLFILKFTGHGSLPL